MGHCPSAGGWIQQRRDGHPQGFWRHFARPAPPATPGARGRQAGPGPFPNQPGFKFRQGSKNAKHSTPIRRRRIDLCAGPGQDFEPHVPLLEFVRHTDEMFEVAA